jgi:uncharacterized protein with ParB-like and HNH nuclease domain
MQRTQGSQDISWFLDLNDKGQLDLDPPYQRRSVWSRSDKQYFIDTILNNLPAPPIFLHKSLDHQGRPTYHVVDGKQRLQTIIHFTHDKLRIADDFADINLQKKKWSQLDQETKKNFWNYVIVTEMLPDVTDASVKNIFERINRNSRKLMPQELRHAKYEGWFINTAEAEAEKQEWKDLGVVTAARIKRMADVQFISELMNVIIRGKIEGFDQDELDEVYAAFEDLNENPNFIEDDFRSQLESSKQYIKEIAALKPELIEFFKAQSHFYTLWGYLTTEKARRLPPADFAPRYLNFLNEVAASIGQLRSDEEPESERQDVQPNRAVLLYALNARGASTDLTPRQTRHDVLVTVMHGPEAVAHENR